MPGVARRSLLGAGLAALAGAAGGCGSDAKSGSATSAIGLWCWPDGLGKGVVADAVKQFATLTPQTVDGDYLAKLTPALSSNPAPAIVGIKGEDIPALIPRADLFVDLNTLGAREVQGEYLDWKWQQGSTLDNRLVGFPIDIGPTAMFYRADLFQKAGLAAEPDAVAKAIPNWAAFLEVGRKLRKTNVLLISNAAGLFANCCQQQPKRFVDESNHYIGDSAPIRTAWDIAVEAVKAGLSAGISNEDKKWGISLNQGRVATDAGPAWHASDLIAAAPDTKGRWRVANGAADGANVGGSFLAVPANGPDHETAFTVIKWILSPENQSRMFAEAALFPSAPAAYKMAPLLAADPFFGGQKTAQVFAASAAKKKRSFQAPADEAIQFKFAEQLQMMERDGTDAATAWKNALANGRTTAQSRGVLTE